jgi:NADH-quinone oxidoreductase subunit E
MADHAAPPDGRPTFSDNAKRRIKDVVARYPDAQAACLPVLHIAQEEFGWCSDGVIDLVAETLGLSSAHVYGVVTFYTMFHRHHVGKRELMVCTNVSCMLRGGYKMLHHIEQRLGVKAGETTPDGKFTVVEEECLAACANAPMMICGDEYYLDLDEAKIDRILEELRR